MVHDFQAGDFLIFQLEAGYGLLRVIQVEEHAGDAVWHVMAYGDLFLDPAMAESALADPGALKVEIPHVALTNRAFESTQVAKLLHKPLEDSDLLAYRQWVESDVREVVDRSIRLVLGLR
jgi:hypothetical protein